MKPAPVVSNSSPLIALQQIGQIDLFRVLFETILIAPAVSREVVRSVAITPWMVVTELQREDLATKLPITLGRGETETISLAMENGARWVILDDLPARREAKRLGLPVLGSLGMLLAAKRRGFIPALGPLLAALTASGFHTSENLRELVLRESGEW